RRAGSALVVGGRRRPLQAVGVAALVDGLALGGRPEADAVGAGAEGEVGETLGLVRRRRTAGVLRGQAGDDRAAVGRTVDGVAGGAEARPVRVVAAADAGAAARAGRVCGQTAGVRAVRRSGVTDLGQTAEARVVVVVRRLVDAELGVARVRGAGIVVAGAPRVAALDVRLEVVTAGRHRVRRRVRRRPVLRSVHLVLVVRYAAHRSTGPARRHD